MRAATYARYSTDKQRSASIEDQMRVCRQEIARRGWEATLSWSDAEVSGTVSRQRPGYQELLKAAGGQEFDVLVVDELCRLSRDPEELAGLAKRLRFWGIGLVAVADGIDTLASPQSAGLIMGLRAAMSEAELEQIAHRTRRGLAGRVEHGHSPGGAPYGYRSRPIHADRPGDPPGTGPIIGYEPITYEPEAEVVRRIFDLYRDGKSARTIAAALNAEGVPPPGARWTNRKTRVARTWSASAISGSRRRGTGILNNERYIGRLVWNRSRWLRDPDRETRVRRDRGKQEWVITQRDDLRIVPQELWDEVKRLQEERSVENDYSASHRRDRRLLSGFLVCGECGSRFVMHNATHYACAGRLNGGDGICTSKVTVNAGWAEQAMLGLVQTALRHEQTIRKMIAQARAQTAESVGRQEQADGLRHRLARADEEARRLVAAIAGGALVEDLQQRMQEVEARRQRLREELDAVTGDNADGADAVPGLVKSALADLRVMIDAGEMRSVRRAMSRMVKRIDVKGAQVPGRKRPEPRLYLHGNLPGLLMLVPEKARKQVAGAHHLPDVRKEEPVLASHWRYVGVEHEEREMERMGVVT